MAGCLYARFRTDATRRTWCVWNDGSIPHFARCISKLVFRLKLRQHNMTKIEGARGPLVELCSIRWLKDHRIGWFGSFRFAPPPRSWHFKEKHLEMGTHPTDIKGWVTIQQLLIPSLWWFGSLVKAERQSNSDGNVRLHIGDASNLCREILACHVLKCCEAHTLIDL